MSSPFNIILNIFNFYNFLTSENHRLKSPIRVVFHLERPGVVWMRQKTMKSLDDLWSRPSHDAPNLTISLTFFTLSYTWPTLLILLVVEFIAGYTHLHKTQARWCSTVHSFSKIQPSFPLPFFLWGKNTFLFSFCVLMGDTWIFPAAFDLLMMLYASVSSTRQVLFFQSNYFQLLLFGTNCLPPM